MRVRIVAVLLLGLAVTPALAGQPRKRPLKETGPAGLAQPAKPATAAQPTRARGTRPNEKPAAETPAEPPAAATTR